MAGEHAKIIAKAWRDPAFKAQLMANPAATLEAEGINVPAGVTVTVVENTGKHFHLVLPPKPSRKLSDSDESAMSDGAVFHLDLPFEPQLVVVTDMGAHWLPFRKK